MSGKKSRDKGIRFELKIAKMLSDATGLEMRRTPLSGGWAKGSPDVAGDIVCVNDPEFPFSVECKCQEGWKLESLLTDKHAWFDSWWMQAYNECPDNKTPLLVFSKNRTCVLAAMFEVDTVSGVEDVNRLSVCVNDIHPLRLCVAEFKALLPYIVQEAV